jgi:uncharacterized protein YcbX
VWTAGLTEPLLSDISGNTANRQPADAALAQQGNVHREVGADRPCLAAHRREQQSHAPSLSGPITLDPWARSCGWVAIRSSRCSARADEAELAGAGIVGDRRHALIDEATGLVASAKNPRKWRGLLKIISGYDRETGRLVLTLPEGTVLGGDDPARTRCCRATSAGRSGWRGAARTGASLERLTPEVETGAGELTRGTLAAGTPGDTFVDFAPVHVITTATLGALSADHRRFRPNVVLRMLDPKPFAENEWPGRTLRVGDRAALRVIVPTPRCAVPTLAQGNGLPDDGDVFGRRPGSTAYPCWIWVIARAPARTPASTPEGRSAWATACTSPGEQLPPLPFELGESRPHDLCAAIEVRPDLSHEPPAPIHTPLRVLDPAADREIGEDVVEDDVDESSEFGDPQLRGGHVGGAHVGELRA